MKLSIETYNLLKKFDEEKAFSVIKNAGFDCVDFSFYWLKEKEEQVLGENYIEYAKKIRGLLDNHNLVCNQAHAPFDFNISVDTMDENNPNYAKIIRSMRSASIMGAKVIVVHPQYAAPNESFLETNIRFYQSLEKYCIETGVKIAVENIFPSKSREQDVRPIGDRFAYPQSMKEIMAALSSKYFVICVDVGHCATVGLNPEEFIKSFSGERLQALHIHDNDYASDQHLLPFMGSISWKNVMSALKDIQYQGELTFEIFGFLNNLDEELIMDGVNFAEKVGRKLIKMIG